MIEMKESTFRKNVAIMLASCLSSFMELFLFWCLLLVFPFVAAAQNYDVLWSNDFTILYGQDHTQLLNQGKEIELFIDQFSGSSS